jgi:hypothetical protein
VGRGNAMTAAAPLGVVTFLFTDIEGSTRRWEADAEGMRTALAAHDEVLRTAIEAHRGWLFKHTGVVAKLGSSRVREVVLATAFVPPEGKSLVDTLTGPWAPTARRNAKKGGLSKTPALGVRFTYLNGVPRARRKFIAGKLYAEPARMLAEKVSRHGMPDDVPRTWILTRRDRALSVKLQHKGIEALGGVQTLVPIDACHCLMVSEPEWLAEICIERCRLYV